MTDGISSGTVEVKCGDLIGPALDWAVFHAEDLHSGWCEKGVRLWLLDFKPSTDWSQGGPLIEKYMIDFTVDAAELIFAYPCPDGSPNELGEGCYAKTHLVAACRAIVAAHLGEVVSVPAELTQPK